MKKKAPAKKYYTVHEANASLPLVRAIVSDVVALAADMRQQYSRIEQVRRNDDDEPIFDEADKAADAALQALRDGNEQMKEYVRELQKLGIELKDFHTGLIDFRSVLEGREVYLCWRLGEPEVAYWHELDAGYAGRQKLVRTSMPALAKGAT
jgi:hypothetical protein